MSWVLPSFLIELIKVKNMKIKRKEMKSRIKRYPSLSLGKISMLPIITLI